MGVKPAEVEDFQEEPSTPPSLRENDSENIEDDLFYDTGTKTTNVFNFDHEIDFRSILPVLPAKGVFEDFLGVYGFPDSPKEKYCGKCFEDVKRDLRKLAEVVDIYKNERDEARRENEVLKKEVEELKSKLKEKEEKDKGVTINVGSAKGNFDIQVKCVGDETEKVNDFGILSFSITLPKDKFTKPQPTNVPDESKPKKTIAELRREFFEKEFESQQSTFTAHNYIEIKPEEKKESFRSKLNIRVKPKKKISDLISKLTSRIGNQKVIPDPVPIHMFQRFEKTKTVWVNEFEGKAFI